MAKIYRRIVFFLIRFYGTCAQPNTKYNYTILNCTSVWLIEKNKDRPALPNESLFFLYSIRRKYKLMPL